MDFFNRLFGRKVDGMELARSAQREEYAQIGLLAAFAAGRSRHDERQQREWSRVLPRSYDQQLELFLREGWIEKDGDSYRTTAEAGPLLAAYGARQEEEKARAMAAVRGHLDAKESSEALDVRRRYESTQPLGRADWTGPDPQLSHSALTRRILFLDHWLVSDLSPESGLWLKSYAAEQHLWGTNWRLEPDEIPPHVVDELEKGALSTDEAAYWRAYQLALYVENQETWQRCKGGDHVRRIEIAGPDDDYTCDHCRSFYGDQYLVSRVPDLPHRECSSARGCRCAYRPVLDTYEDRE